MLQAGIRYLVPKTMKTNTKKIFGIVVVVAAVIVLVHTTVGAVYYNAEPDAPESFNPIVATSTQTAGAITSAAPKVSPMRLQIPSLGIDAKVQSVGVNAKGNMGVPTNFTDVAWYKLGTVPGKPGAAVIDGHVDNGLALAGVFKHLSEIKVGADLYVVGKDGSKLHFIVSDIQTYPYNNAPARDIFTSTDGDAHLNLVTCTGAWVPGDKTYNQRLVVFSKLVK